MSETVRLLVIGAADCVSELLPKIHAWHMAVQYCTAEEAGELLEEGGHHVAFACDGLAGAGGLSHGFTAVPVIAVVDDSSRRAAEAALAAGAVDYLVRGAFDAPLLERAIRYALDWRRARLRLEQLSERDALTGLVNRSVFARKLDEALVAARDARESLSLLLLDLDRFNGINELFGHDVGDAVLQVVAERVVSCAADAEVIGRLGSDEIAVMLRGPDAAKDAVELAGRLLAAVAQPIVARDRICRVTASIGMSVFPSDGTTTVELMRSASAAMSAAKARGNDTYQCYEASMGQHVMERHSLERQLRTAIEREEFELHFQPQVVLATGRVMGLEALLRWNQPERGRISPAQFVPVLEETGLIVPVGEWVLRTALEQQLVWSEMGMPLRMAVNVSAVQFRRRDLHEVVERALRDTGADPSQLELEITEGFLIDDIDECRRILASLKALGVRIAIDDFGTGYSSLTYLRRFPIDVLKIDRSFVRDVGRDDDATAIVAAIIALAHKLQIEVIAEGVETQAQRDFLSAQGCEIGQGYLFSPPLPAVWQSHNQGSDDQSRAVGGKR